jgi:hypothetical protein
LGPARYVPLEPLAVLTMTPLAAAALLDEVDEEAGAAALDAVDEEAGVDALPVLLELPHPAMIRAAVASTATPPMRNFGVLRLAMVSSQFAVFTGPVKMDG